MENLWKINQKKVQIVLIDFLLKISNTVQGRLQDETKKLRIYCICAYLP